MDITAIENITVSAYKVPTDQLESDGTYQWDSPRSYARWGRSGHPACTGPAMGGCYASCRSRPEHSLNFPLPTRSAQFGVNNLQQRRGAALHASAPHHCLRAASLPRDPLRHMRHRNPEQSHGGAVEHGPPVGLQIDPLLHGEHRFRNGVAKVEGVAFGARRHCA